MWGVWGEHKGQGCCGSGVKQCAAGNQGTAQFYTWQTEEKCLWSCGVLLHLFCWHRSCTTTK